MHDHEGSGTRTQDDPAFQAALTPERRYASITLGTPKHGYPGDQALFFEFLDNNGTTLVNLRPGDMPVLRAAVAPESEGLKALMDIWSANLGPGGQRAVEAGHAAGYRLGVSDMENTPAHRTAPVEAAEVRDFLLGLMAATTTRVQREYLSGVLEQLAGAATEPEQPAAWTADTMAAHLQSLHGVDELPEERSLMWLLEVHDGLNHGQPAKPAEDPAFLVGAATEPEQPAAPRIGAADVERYLGHLDTDELSADEQEAIQTVLEVLTRDKIAWRA